MQWRALFHLGHRMAQKNNLFLFAWLCAIVVPVILQVIADFRDFLLDWYGVPSLYMLFTLTYGFASVFISYYQASSYRKAGTLDLLRTANFRPGQVLWGVFSQLQTIVGPPVIVFCTGLLVYAQFDPINRGWMRGMRVPEAFGVMLLLLLIQGMLTAVPLLGLFKRGEVLALACLPIVLPLNVAPMFVSQSRGLAGLAAVGVMAVLLAIMLLAAWLRLSRLWPPQRI
jgi:hypothetical protein